MFYSHFKRRLHESNAVDNLHSDRVTDRDCDGNRDRDADRNADRGTDGNPDYSGTAGHRSEYFADAHSDACANGYACTNGYADAGAGCLSNQPKAVSDGLCVYISDDRKNKRQMQLMFFD